MQPSSLISFHLNPYEVTPNLHNLVMCLKNISISTQWWP